MTEYDGMNLTRMAKTALSKIDLCHSVGNLAKRFDGVNLTAPEVQGCNNAVLFFLINCEAYHEYQRKINKRMSKK